MFRYLLNSVKMNPLALCPVLYNSYIEETGWTMNISQLLHRWENTQKYGRVKRGSWSQSHWFDLEAAVPLLCHISWLRIPGPWSPWKTHSNSVADHTGGLPRDRVHPLGCQKLSQFCLGGKVPKLRDGSWRSNAKVGKLFCRRWDGNF